MKVLEINPTDGVETPALKKRLPKYLSLNEGVELLKNVQSDFYERDYCILTLFLNCGMRLSELVNINITDIHDDGTIRIVGKGNKDRLVYLNDARRPACYGCAPVLPHGRGNRLLRGGKGRRRRHRRDARRAD